MTEPMDSPNLPSLVHLDQMHLRLPSRPDLIEPAVEYLKTRAVLCGACQESRAAKLTVALHEALSNAVVHGNLELSSDLKERGDDSFAQELAARAADPRLAGRSVDVAVDYDGARCRWVITDEGNGFDIAGVLGRLQSDEPNVLLASGRGILMMRSFLDDVAYEAGGRRCVLTLQRASGAERRQHARAAVSRPLRVAPIRPDGSVDWDAAYEAVSKNISEDGLSLLQSRLATTERVLIGILTDGEPLYVAVEVRHCRALDGGLVELGCRFEARVGADAGPRQKVQEAVGGLLERFHGGGPAPEDRRAHRRLVYNERIEIRAEGQGGPLAGFARDLSRGGIAFITTQALSPRAYVLLLPQHGGPPLHVRAEVVRCTRVQDGFYDVAAHFLELE